MGLFLSGFWGLQTASYRLMAKSNLVKSLPIRRSKAKKQPDQQAKALVVVPIAQTLPGSVEPGRENISMVFYSITLLRPGQESDFV